MTARIVPFDSAIPPDEQARQWIVRIDAGALTAEERERLKTWLAEDSRHADLLDTQALLWNAASKATFPPAAAPAAKRAPAPRRRTFLAAATCASLIAAAATWRLAFGLVDRGYEQGSFSTAVGEHRPIALADGSSVHLNTASAVKLVYGTSARQVILERGEGYFAVAKDAARPFEVVVGQTVVRAVGTRFTVQRLGESQVEVTVFEGVVEVRDGSRAAKSSQASTRNLGGQPLRLGVGQTVTDETDRIVLRTLAEPDLDRRLAWQNERIVFDKTPLAEAVEEVNRYSSSPIVVGDPALQDVQISGSFSTREIPVFIRSLERGFGLKVEQRAGRYEITRDAKS